MRNGEVVRIVGAGVRASKGSAGLETQLPGCMLSVTNIALSSGIIEKA